MKLLDIKKFITYDFSDINLSENSLNNCFGCDSCDHDSLTCDCDSDNFCDHKW